MITLHFPDCKTLDLTVDDNSFCQKVLMGDDTLNLSYSLPYYLEIPQGTYCWFQNRKYTLEKPENFQKHGGRNYEYSLVLGSEQDRLNRYLVHSIVPGDVRLKFTLTGKPKDFMELLIGNLNDPERLAKGDQMWTYDGENLVESNEKVVSFSFNTCMEALRMIADAFETEWEIRGNKIWLRKVEYNKDPSHAIRLSYGKGNGFLPGIGKAEYSEGAAVGVLYVQGGERNIDPNKYRKVIIEDENDPAYPGVPGSSQLRLPDNAALWYDGTGFFETKKEAPEDAVKYVTDAEGLCVKRAAGQLSINEGSLDLTNIYPMREGNVDQVFTPKQTQSKLYEFRDNAADIPDYKEALFEGSDLMIIFQSGMLAGKEFKVNYEHPGHFTILKETIDNIEMPDEYFCPKVDQKYVVLNIMADVLVPEAEQKLFREAVKYLWEHETPRFTFTGTLDSIWAKRNWTTGEVIGPKLMLGGYVLFSDTQFLPEGELIRITAVKEYVNNPHSPEIELSNDTKQGSSYYNTIRRVESNEVTTESNDRRIRQFTERRFRDVQETTEMLQDAIEGFSSGIRPVTVHTMQMVAGESLQFRFLDTKNNDEVYDLPIRIDGDHLHLEATRLQHMTIWREKIMEGAPVYRRWDIAASSDANINEYPAETSFYLYARVSKPDENTPADEILGGVYELRPYTPAPEEELGEGQGTPGHETGALSFEDDTYYNLLIAIINSESGGKRSIVRMYGFTEILPGRITTDRIVSADGNCNINLADNSFHFGDGKVDSEGKPAGNYLDWSVVEELDAEGNVIDRNGKLEVSGKIEATDGHIGGFKIGQESLASDNGSIALKYDGSGLLAGNMISWNKAGVLNVGPFSVSRNEVVVRNVNEDPTYNSRIIITDNTVESIQVANDFYSSTLGSTYTKRTDRMGTTGPGIPTNKIVYRNSVTIRAAGVYKLKVECSVTARAYATFPGRDEYASASVGAGVTFRFYNNSVWLGESTCGALAGVAADTSNPKFSLESKDIQYSEWSKTLVLEQGVFSVEGYFPAGANAYRIFVENPNSGTTAEASMSAGAKMWGDPTNRETIIGNDGILVRQDSNNQFQIYQNPSTGKISISIKGLPTAVAEAQPGGLYRNGNYLMIKPES